MSDRDCDCDSLLNCNVEYLKAIVYDDLFDEKTNKCTDYKLIMFKLTEARNAFFLFQSALFNFIKDCTLLKQKIREDTSGNDLESLRYEYIGLLNTLINQIAVSMRKKIKDDNSVLISFEVPMTQASKTIENIQNIWPTNVVYTDVTGVNTLIVNLPSVSIYLTASLQLQVKFINNKSVNYSNLLYDNSHIKTHCSKDVEIFIRNITPELEFNGSHYTFRDAEHMNNILEDLINYNCDDNITTHQMKDVVDRLEGICNNIVNSHRSVVQKIKTEKIIESQLK